jgi:hypothetical protein
MRHRPLLLGYIRADVFGGRADVSRLEASLRECADREDFCLGTVYVEQRHDPGAFHALMAEVGRDETVWGIVVPDLRHVGAVEQLILNRHEAGSRMAVLVAHVPPVPADLAPSSLRARSAVPPVSSMPRRG